MGRSRPPDRREIARPLVSAGRSPRDDDPATSIGIAPARRRSAPLKTRPPVPNHPTLRIERILLLAWTVALTMLVALKIGSIPPSLAWALLPYLALVARHLTAPIDRKSEAPSPAP